MFNSSMFVANMPMRGQRFGLTALVGFSLNQPQVAALHQPITQMFHQRKMTRSPLRLRQRLLRPIKQQLL
jgi:hypothetical protein